MSSYIEEHRERFGVEPICRTLEVSASAYYERRTGWRSQRAIGDERLLERIREVQPSSSTSPGSTTTACTNPWAMSLPWSSRAYTVAQEV